MSFFFTKAKPRASAPSKTGAGSVSRAGANVTASMRRNAPTLTRLGCKACTLNTAPVTTPKMQPTLARETLVYFLGEAPGKHEDEESGRPLTGPSGSLLRDCIPPGDEKYCSFDNVIRDRPPNNRDPAWLEIECCRGHIIKSIEQAKPKLVVGLGLFALQWMLKSSDLAGMRGRLFAVQIGTHTCWFMPTYHPSFVLHTAYDKRKPLNSKMGHAFRLDLRRAFNVASTLKKPVIETTAEIKSGIECFDGRPGQLAPLLKLLQAATAAPLKAIDLETKGLRPFSTGGAIMTAAVSYDTINFAFAIDHPKALWRPDEKKQVLAAFKKLLTNRKSIKVAHNLPFEMEWLLWLYGPKVIDHDGWECTQMQAHFIDERRGKKARGDEDDERRATYQKLEFLVRQYFGITYKPLFKLNKKDMSKSDLGETLLYNGCDTKYTLKLHHHQIKELRKQKLLDAYLDALPRQVTVAVMQSLGINVDQKKVKEFQTKLGGVDKKGNYSGEIGDTLQEIFNLKVVKAYIKDHKTFNPQGEDALILFRDYLHRKEVHIEADPNTGQVARSSIDKNVLDKIDHPLAALIIKLRNKTKLRSTYVDVLEYGVGEQIYPDGLIHCNFNTTFAETGRTSSDQLNMQNFPQRQDAWVREEVCAEEGNVLVAFDYGQLEACTAAMCSKDKVLVKALWDDYDIHTEWSHKAYDKYPEIIEVDQSIDDEKVFKKLRSRIKNKLVFPAIFGAQNKSIAGYLNMPEDKVDDLMDEFWGIFHGLKTWQDKLMTKFYDTGIVTSFEGRAHRYPLTRNQAINHPVQCLAAAIVCEAMNRLSIKAVTEQQWYLHPRLNVHDDLTFSIPDKDAVLEKAIQDIYRIMLTPSYSCVNVPLSVSASVGTHWFGMTEIGKFWSHRDL